MPNQQSVIHNQMTGILIIGAGGHGKVVADILLGGGNAVLGFLDDDPTTWQSKRLGLAMLGAIDSYKQFAPDSLAMGIGSSSARLQIATRLGEAAPLWLSAITMTHALRFCCRQSSVVT